MEDPTGRAAFVEALRQLGAVEVARRGVRIEEKRMPAQALTIVALGVRIERSPTNRGLAAAGFGALGE